MRGGTIAVIGPGNSDGSRLYQRLIGSQFGAQMPPTGALSADKVAIIKAWIDQGADWPDSLSGDQTPSTPDLDAVQLIAAIKKGDRARFSTLLKANPAASQKKGEGGMTPLMTAALDGDVTELAELLKEGAAPNATNEAGATALMWSITDAKKTELLLAAGARPDVKSLDGRTPLLIAAAFRESQRSAELLLNAHADPNVVATDGSTALSQAAFVNNPVLFEQLVAGGASLEKAGSNAVIFAIQVGCARCAELLLAPGALPKNSMTESAALLTPPFGDAMAITSLIERGADPKATDRNGLTLLMAAAASDFQPVDVIRLLISKGADVNAVGPKGETALSRPRQRGATPGLDLLLKSQARDVAASTPESVRPAPAASIAAALARSVP